MSEMIKRVAWALAFAESRKPVTECEPPTEAHYRNARVAIATMRLPTKAMLKVADSFGNNGRRLWPEMVDAALTD